MLEKKSFTVNLRVSPGGEGEIDKMEGTAGDGTLVCCGILLQEV